MASITTVSIKHEDILNFILANPTMKLGDVALLYGVTQPWLSTIIHSDCFQARLSEKQGDIFATALLPIGEKLTALAHSAIDKLADQIPLENDTETVRKTTDTVLKALGYGGNVQSGQSAEVINNTYVVQANVLAKARDRIGANSPAQIPVTLDQEKVVTHANEHAVQSSPAQGVPALGASGVGSPIDIPAELPQTTQTEGQTSARDAL